MSDVIELENRVEMADGTRMIHLMSNRELTAVDLVGYWPPEDARMDVSREGGAWHLRAQWPHVEVREARPGHPYVICQIRQGERISQAVGRAVKDYLRLHGHGPQFVYLRHLPRGVKLGYVILYLGWEIILLQADWVSDGCVMAGETGAQFGEASEQIEFETLPAPMVKA